MVSENSSPNTMFESRRTRSGSIMPTIRATRVAPAIAGSMSHVPVNPKKEPNTAPASAASTAHTPRNGIRIPTRSVPHIPAAAPDPGLAAEALVEAAIRGGGRDNITAIVVNVEGDDPELGTTNPRPKEVPA